MKPGRDPEVEAFFASAHLDAVALRREEARLRLTCAALTGLYACGDAGERVPLMAVGAADACLALLYPAPEGGSDGR